MSHRDFLVKEASKIYNSLGDSNNFFLVDEPSLLGGRSGVALFFFYYHRIMQSKEAHDKGMEYLQWLTDSGDRLKDFSLGNGVLGVAWLFQHLHQNGFINTVPKFDVVDELSPVMLTRYAERQNYDSFYGLIGIGNYYLDQQPISSHGREILEHVVDQLLKMAVTSERGTYWNNFFSVSRDSADQRAQDLGLAHGVPSIIVFLSRIKAAQIYPRDLTQVINDTCTWMLSMRGTYPFGRYANKVIDGRFIGTGRLGWCYGDLGVAISLMAAYEATGNEVAGNNGLELLLACARRTLPTSNVYFFPEADFVDGAFCHGTMGLSYIFWKLYRKYRHVEFQNAYDYWLGVTKKYANERPLGGYIKFMYTTETGYPYWQGVTGLLDGAAGVGLCFLTMLDQSQNNIWDSIFALS